MVKTWLSQLPMKGLNAVKLQSNRKFRVDGDLARDNKDWEGAAENYQRYLAASPDDTDIWVQLGHVLKEQGNLTEAESAYRRASILAPSDSDARLHLAHLLKKLDRPQQAAIVFQELLQIAPTGEVFDELKGLGYGDRAANLLAVLPVSGMKNGRYFELRDLLQYLSSHATVTGITRVVLGLLDYIFQHMDEAEAESYNFVQQYGDAEGLLLLSKQKIRRLAIIATSATPDLASMQDLIADIRRAAPIIKLQPGDLYFMPGAFWEFVFNPGWLPSLKQQGVYVGCYIYDLIPITHSHFCTNELSDSFGMAFSEVSRSFDFTLTISKFVAKQVTGFLQRHEIPAFPAMPVPLAHELHFDTERKSKLVSQAINADIHALDRPFVLCVCTIEARKNHIYLFYIWQQMIDAGVDVPDLVFVGRHGWRIADLLSQISASRNLGGRLHVMHGLSDTDLGFLYERCLFTVFPSFVEGWGLPVGESLAHGKVCVASSATAIPEAGGEYAVYIDPFNMASGYETIHRLITDPAYLAQLEAKIRKEFSPRTWQDVGRDFYQALDRALDAAPPPSPNRISYAPTVKPGELLDMPGIQQATVQRAQYAENPIRLLLIHGWRGVEATGTWMKDSQAKICIQTDYLPGTNVSILLKVSHSPWVVEKKNTMRVWASDLPTRRQDPDNAFLYNRPMSPSAQAWIRLKGQVGPGGIITVRFQIEGIVISNAGDLPVAFRLHAIGFSASDDVVSRMDLLEHATLLSPLTFDAAHMP